MKKYSSVFLLIFILFMTIYTIGYAESMPKPPEESREELYHDMFITLLFPYMNEPIDQFYSKFLSASPMVHGYMVDVISAKRVYGYRSFKFIVTLEVTPVVGPHISVGKDRLVFDIDPSGPKLLKLEHLETHELPDHWKHIIKNQSDKD
ncbi:uncharacterized protein DUF3888 [Bacillus oleivorans]|uniref:Uncharacterized protein DUF3888 n=1 Tax=Bacillus oleivorans TaxID=1448271 RepID=A0A285D6K0_9BACI|nr:DUF3888 domain-containing protein [Bacillus oleivorans]SNX75437.1 uncharacterized protein DUF3888 [Bacillus oleivorans]